MTKDKKSREGLITGISIVVTIIVIVIGIMGMNKPTTVVNIYGNIEVTTVADNK